MLQSNAKSPLSLWKAGRKGGGAPFPPEDEEKGPFEQPGKKKKKKKKGGKSKTPKPGKKRGRKMPEVGVGLASKQQGDWKSKPMDAPLESDGGKESKKKKKKKNKKKGKDKKDKKKKGKKKKKSKGGGAKYVLERLYFLLEIQNLVAETRREAPPRRRTWTKTLAKEKLTTDNKHKNWERLLLAESFPFGKHNTILN